MSGEIEFLEPEPDPGPEPARDGPNRRAVHAVAALGWLAAAVLAVVASFRPIDLVDLPRRFADYLPLQGVDGWGRGPGGGPLFGIALTACGAVLGLLAVLHLTSRARRFVAGAAIGAPALLTGVVAMLALYSFAMSHGVPAAGWTAYTSLHSSYGSTLTISTASPMSPGPGLWLSVSALVCALAGSAGYLAWQARSGRLAG